MAFGLCRPDGLRPILMGVEAGLDDLDQDEVGGDHPDQDEEEASGSAVKPSASASGVNGRTAPIDGAGDRA